MEPKSPTWHLMLLLAFGSFVAIATANSSWKLCSSTEDYRVRVSDVSVTPDPVVRGETATFEIPAVTSETITDGTIIVQAYYLGVLVHTETDSLCAKTSCPVAPGEFSIKNSEGLPEFAPIGSYRIDMHVQDTDGDVLTCVKINFRITTSEIQSG